MTVRPQSPDGLFREKSSQSRQRLKMKKAELEKLRMLSFNMFKSLTEVIKSLDE